MRTESHLNRAQRGSSATHEIWAAIATIGTRQHGVISRPQLLGCGLSDDAIDRLIESRRLHRIHDGVYAVGHRALTKQGRYMAAVLSAGPGAILSHRSGADLWEVRATREPRIDVIVPTHR